LWGKRDSKDTKEFKAEEAEAEKKEE